MKFLILVTITSGLAAAAPAYEALIARAVTTPKSSIKAASTSSAKASSTTKATGTPLLNVGVGGSSSPLVNIGLGGATLIAIGGSAGKSSSLVAVPSSTKAATITVAPKASSATYPTVFPSTFSAPIQGQGKLTLENLPAMPAVIDKTFSGVLGAVIGLVSGVCSNDFKCSITMAGSIESLLVDGNNYTANTTINAWCDNGKCYGSANPTVTATAPFVITCDKVSGTNACSATISGLVSAIFSNGKQVEAWGWITPAGYCQNGICTASITAFGDPMY